MEFMANTIDPQAINLPMKIGIPCKNRIEIAAAQRDLTKSFATRAISSSRLNLI